MPLTFNLVFDMIKGKTKREIEIMAEGGRKLAEIKEALREMIAPGKTPLEVDQKAEELMLAAGGTPSFKTVKNYHWATCININEGVVHGIPTKVPFKEGDLVKVDLGLFYQGLHTDTSFTYGLGKMSPEIEKFVKTGQLALDRAIEKAKPGNRVSDIARAMQEVIEREGYSPARLLTGHGIGQALHEEPAVPCFWTGPEPGEVLPEGAVLAIEAIYTLGPPEMVVSPEDGWTIATKDGKIAGYFEETVAVGRSGPQVLTT